MTPEQLVDIVESLSVLTDLPRTGWVMRGVSGPESVAAHSFGVGLTAMMIVDALREKGGSVDGEKVLRMALLHDAAEAKTGDIPMPSKTAALRQALGEHELSVVREMLSSEQAEIWRESEEGESLEARIVKAADKLQMMIQVSVYESQGRGKLSEFHENPANQRSQGLAFVEACHRIVRQRAGWAPFVGEGMSETR